MAYLDDFQYIDAPLKKLPLTWITERNSKVINCSGAINGGFAPYVNNKCALAEFTAATRVIPFAVSPEVNYSFFNDDGSAPVGTISTLMNLDLSQNVIPYNAHSPVFFIETQTLGEYIKEKYPNAVKIIRCYPTYGYALPNVNSNFFDAYFNANYRPANTIRFSTPAHFTGTTPTPTEGYNLTFNSKDIFLPEQIADWVIIKRIEFFDGEKLPRNHIDKYIFPTVFYKGGSSWYISDTTPNAQKKGYYTNITIAFPMSPDVLHSSSAPDAETAVNVTAFLSGAIIANWRRPDRYSGYNPAIISAPIIFNGSGNEMMVAIYNDTNPAIASTGYNSLAYYGDSSGDCFITTTGIDACISGTAPIPIYKNFDEIKALFADYGFIATDNLDDAENMPLDFFPSDTSGIVPDGGEPTGFPTNPTPNIPNYPDNTTDIINLNPPNVSALSSAGVYAFNLIQSKSFLNWLMTDDFTQNISNLFNDKLSAVGDLKILPFDIATHDPSHATPSSKLTVGNVTGENLPCHIITDGYNTLINGGEYSYTAYYGDFNDYERCSYAMYVPYAGIMDLNAADVVNKTLTLTYAVDLLTGNATAIIRSNGVIIKTSSAVMGVSVPITFTNNNQRHLNNALTALSVGNSLLGGAISSISSGSPMPVINSAICGIFRGVTNDMTNPLVTGHTGSFGNGTGLSMPQTAFLIITRQIIAMPSNYKNAIGIPATYRGKISEFVGSGFVSISADKIDISCTQSEREEILGTLSRGVYL